jgi:predicted transcriptional regulator
VEEIQRQNRPIVKEYKKFYVYRKEYEQRNLNILDMNGQLISEKRKLMDRWKESFQEKLNNHAQLNLELRMEEVDFNVTNKEISETTYLEVKDKLLKFKHLKTPGVIVTTTDIAIYM